MRMPKAIVGMTHCFLALLILLPTVPLHAHEKTRTPKQEVTRADNAAWSDSNEGTAADASSTSKKEALKAAAPSAELVRSGVTGGDLATMKEQIASQQKQIEALQAALEAQKQALEKAMNAMATSGRGGTAIINAAYVRTSADTNATPTALPLPPQAEQQKLADLEIVKGELEAVAESTAAANHRLTRIESETAAYTKANDAKIKQLGNFNFSGDTRIRYEPFFQAGALDRHRERVRVRVNLTGKLTEELSGGVSLATGSLDDPVSTNQTFTGFFNRKNFAIDKAWVTYKPNYAKFLKLDAGKFAYPWYRTPMTFDNDVNPEGFAETLSFDVKSPVLKNITVVGFQLPINEVSGGYDSFVLGGQLQGQFQIGSKMRLGLYGAGINVNRADPIAIALGGSLIPSLANSNTLRLDKNGKVVGYASKFAYLDAIAKLDINTSSRFPTTLQFDFVNNVRGSRERSGYWADFTIGRLKEVGDLQFTYSFIRIEKDAVMGAWNESDLRSSTNVRNQRLQVGYQMKGNMTAQFTAWIGKLANPLDNVSLVPSGVRSACTGANTLNCVDPFLKRLQFDLIYKF